MRTFRSFLWNLLNALTSFFFAFMMIAINLANLASGAAYGIFSTQPRAIPLWGAERHPVQVYGAFLGSILFGVLWLTSTLERNHGLHFLEFSIFFCLIQLFLILFQAQQSQVTAGFFPTQVAL
jgi:prolipoprotein diacylglyceryltransferase